MKKRILFYSSVKTKEMFSIHGFYRDDISSLQALEYIVTLSNHWLDFIYFWKYDIAFLYFYRYSLVPSIIARFFWKKVYFTGGIDSLDKNSATKKQLFIQSLLFRLCNLFSNGSILVSSADVENVRSLYGSRLPCNCTLSFHAIDVEKFYFTGDFPKKENIYSTIAWMVSIDNMFRKGVDKALNIFSEIVKMEPDALFYIAGLEGEGSEYILKQIENLQLQNKVIYLGSISENDKIEMLKKCKYYFQLSKYEGFGIAAIEALAAGCLVIHSGRGGLKDGIGRYGYKIDIDKPIKIFDLFKSIKMMSNDPIFMKSGMRYIREMFSLEQRINSFSKIIKF